MDILSTQHSSNSGALSSKSAKNEESNSLSFAEFLISAEALEQEKTITGQAQNANSPITEAQLLDLGLLEWSRLEHEKKLEERAQYEIMSQRGLTEEDVENMEAHDRTQFDAAVAARVEQMKEEAQLLNPFAKALADKSIE